MIKGLFGVRLARHCMQPVRLSLLARISQLFNSVFLSQQISIIQN
jgi:hypothetical protein